MKSLDDVHLRKWVIARLSEDVDGEKLLDSLKSVWQLSENLKGLAEEKIAYVKMRAKAEGLTITATSTSCNRKGCYCRGKPLHYPYIKLYKDGSWHQVKRGEVESFIAHYLDKSDADDLLSICSVRNRTLRAYNNQARILACLGLIEY